jgi:hypothetical protein
MESELKKALTKSNLGTIDKSEILEAIEHKDVSYARKVSNAGGSARPGASLEKKGLEFEYIEP